MNNWPWSFIHSRPIPVLERWLGLGMLWLLLGLFLMPSNKLYHQGLLYLLWLPGVVAVFKTPARHRAFDRLLVGLLALSVAWAILSLSWGGYPRQLKEVLYVLLSLNGLLMLALRNPRLFWQLLAYAAFIGGLMGWIALIYHYLILGNDWSVRTIATGQLDHTILASHVMGVLCLILVYLRRRLPQMLQKGYWMFACSGYLAFLLMSRTKGTLLALVACLILSYLWKPSRRSLMVAGMTILCSLIGIVFFPEAILRGGFSSRPELLQLAWEQLQQHLWFGLGLDQEYLLTIPETGYSFRHAHNFYMHLAVELGVIGLMLWLMLLAGVAWRGWMTRHTAAGRVVCALLCFSCIALLTDGLGPWIKPREEWFTVWLPIFLGFCLQAAGIRPLERDPCHCQ